MEHPAITALLELIPPDGVVVSPHQAYLGTLVQLAAGGRRHGLRTRLVDVADTKAVAAAAVGAASVSAGCRQSTPGASTSTL